MIRKTDKEQAFEVNEELLLENRKKFEYILNEIQSLKKDINKPTNGIFAFLLETQLIEFFLQTLLYELDIIRGTQPELLLYNGTKSSKQKPYEELTLGQLKNVMSKYESSIFDVLNKHLPELNKVRVRFAHHIFGMGSIKDLIIEANKGFILNNLVVGELKKIESELDEKTFLRQIMNRKITI